MIARVPDFFEPITAYRSWNVDAQGFLTSANEGKRWKARKAVRAICTANRAGEPHWHPETGATMPAPVAGCTCGYYAFKTDPVVDEYQGKVRGEVKLWGRIIEHESGYRAEFAYPGKLRCASAKLAARLTHLYGVECVVDAPPQNRELEIGDLIFTRYSSIYQAALQNYSSPLVGSTKEADAPQTMGFWATVRAFWRGRA